ncbi:hypothetical protein lerEdw1_013226 [Lerista edwardsae]|nr:hypothetical protein lerEdw1_013226 [Lerista edwardsae]
MSSASSSSEAAAPPGAEPATAGLLWERAWSLEEIRGGSQGWSLAADAGLLHFLQEFSQQTISKTHEIKKQLDRLIHETKSTDCRLHNVFNGFLMLSNTQFIENRVYDEEVEEPTPRSEMGDKSEQEKTREQKEADLIPKIQEAVNYGLQVLDSAFEQLDIKAGNSDSEEETNERVELILEPKDLYIDRPLPYLIGSQLFMEQDDVGLGDLSSEEGSVDSDRGSMIDSEGKDEEFELSFEVAFAFQELEEEFGNISEEEQKPKISLMSDEDEDDLFGDSEKGEEEEEGDLEDNARLRKKRPTSFTDELTARIKGDVPCKQAEEQLHDEDIFKPPKLTDEDFSPFCSKGGLFSGGTGLFDDDESDLFAELPKGKAATENEARVPINDEPSSTAVRKVPAGAVSLFPGSNDVFSPSPFLKEKENKKLTEPISNKVSQLGSSVGLFDDDDFEPNKKCSVSARSADGLFDDADADLFNEKSDVASVAAKERKEVVSGDKSQASSAENVKTVTQTLPKGHKGLFSDEEDSEQDLFSSNRTIKSKSSSVSSNKVTAKTPVSLFDDEDEEELFGSVPKTQVSKPPKEKATSLLFSSDEEDHWNITKEVKPSPQNNQKKENMNSVRAVSHTINKSGLFEEEGEEDLFAITTDSQRKPQKVALLFEDDVVNGDSLFGFQPTDLQSSVQARTADLLETPEKKLVEEKVGPLAEPNASPVPGPEDAGVTERERKPLLEKDARRKVKSVFSLFDEDEKSEDTEVNRSTQKEIEKPPEKGVCPKSTGVFQDEELLFSHKLQKDNDPDVDLFASNKKEVPKPRIKLSSGGGLFGIDDDDGGGEDNLFSTAKSKTQVAEKKLKGSSMEDNKVLESDQSPKREEKLSPETAEANLDINPATLLPTGTSKLSNVKTPPPCPETPGHESHSMQHSRTASAAGSNEETGVSFDYPMQADTLQNANKGRIKMSGKRRPPTRAARRLAAQDNEMNTSEDPPLPPLKETSVPPAMQYHRDRELYKEENTKLPLLTSSTDQLCEIGRSPVSKPVSASDLGDLFESNDLFANSAVSKVTLKSKANVETETLASQVPKGAERLSLPLALDGPNSEDLFQPVKPSKKSSPVSFLEDQDDVFSSKKAVKRKDTKLTVRSDQDPPMHDIFEDDIFASEAVKPSVKPKELEANLFDDDVDIFADLAVKPKEKSTKKKMEAKSIFDEDTDDIFSPSNQSKILTKKSQSFQPASGTKSEFRTSSSFEDPLNAFEGQ